jgi:serine/threonine protein kinase/Tol biopolymer transport system component
MTAPESIGPYHVLAKLGEGGMGEVYRAKDSKLGREVALKVLSASFAHDPERLARLGREAHVLASLNHPNIAQIYGFEDSGSTHALVMELVEGTTLAERIAQGPIPAADAIAIARQVAHALEAAHELGIIHRDLKPANIKVKDDGTVKVLDFGLAKALEPIGGSSPDVTSSPTLTARGTQVGMILGTAAYMAPEQAKGRPVDRRADIWAFGVVLFEMLAGQRAFKGDDVSDVLAAVLRQEIDWKALPADTPRQIRRLLERCLERDPKRRLRDIGDAWLELDAPDEPAPTLSATTAPQTSWLARTLPWVAAIVVAGGSVTWSLVRSPAPTPQQIVRSSTPLKEVAGFVDVSRDGSRLIYATAATPPAPSGITLRMLDQFNGRIVPGTDGLAFALLSPDGQWIAFNTITEPSLKKVPITGGTPSKLCAGSFQNGGAWGDDNTIVFPTSTGLNRVSADGGEPEALTKIDTAKGETSHVRPQFLPGGKQVLFTVNGAEGPKFAVTVIGTGTYKIVGRSGDHGQFVPSGHLLYVRDQTLFAAPFDLSRLEVSGSEVPMVENVSQLGPPGTGDYAVAGNGTLVYFLGSGKQGTTLAWADRAGATKIIPGQAQQNWGTGRLSPNGDLVANSITDGKSVRDVWTFDVERGTLTRLTFGNVGDDADYPIWSPDSKTVYYSGVVGGKAGVYTVSADASSRAKLVLATERRAFPTSVTPDGRTLLYTQQNTEKKTQIFKISLGFDAAAKPEPLHDPAGDENGAAISPDGRWVAYMSNESGANEIYVLPFPGPGPKSRVSLDSGGAPRWSRDGKELLYWAKVPTASLMAVAVTTSPTFRAAQPHKLFEQFSTTTWDTTRDPNRFLVELTSRQEGTTLNIVTNWFEELERRAPAKK